MLISYRLPISLLLILITICSCTNDKLEKTIPHDRIEFGISLDSDENFKIDSTQVSIILDYNWNNKDILSYLLFQFFNSFDRDGNELSSYIFQFDISKSMEHPFISSQEINLDQDKEKEIVLLLGNEWGWSQLLIILDYQDKQYISTMMFPASSRYKTPTVNFYTDENEINIIHLYHGGSAYTGSSVYHHEIFKSIEDSMHHVLSVIERLEMNHTLGSNTWAQIIPADSCNQYEISFYFKYQFWKDYTCDLKTRIGASDDPSIYNWESGNFNLHNLPDVDLSDTEWHHAWGVSSFEDSEMPLLSDSILVSFTWNNDSLKHLPSPKTSSSDINKLNLLQSDNCGFEYSSFFYNSFKEELMFGIDTSNLDRRRTIEFMEVLFGENK